MKTVIKVENIGKQYRLGEIGTGTLSHDLNRWFAKVRGKEDPFGKIGGLNNKSNSNHSEYIWALKDLDFEIKEGEVLGIIGKNGAGKSTLLKLLSKVTRPTTGRILTKGRIASLLEVGTGFHPEMTGRQNIFLNGTIMGMTKIEVKKKLDEIIEFAGVDKYVDTPVKRYSSGMYVRLAFGVAAHLNSEILIVDEVLAVGDAEFQKKCLAKMDDISKGQGRTILFVSHNMGSLAELCTRLILLQQGRLIKDGTTNSVIAEYFNSNRNLSANASFANTNLNDLAYITKIELRNNKGHLTQQFSISDNISIQITFEVLQPNLNLQLAVVLFNSSNVPIFTSHNTDEAAHSALPSLKPGLHEMVFSIAPFFLKADTYFITISLGTPTLLINNFEYVLNMTLSEETLNVYHKGFAQKRPGLVIGQGKWINVNSAYES